METPPRRTVLLAPTDMSAASQASVTYAAALARRIGGTLVLLHVVSPAAVEETAHERYVDKQLEDVRAMLEWWFTTFVPPDVRQTLEVRTMAAVGHPEREIPEIAESLRAEMIVMATHGRRGFSRAVRGSVAEAVLRHAVCPVLTVRVPPSARGIVPLPEAGPALADTAKAAS